MRVQSVRAAMLAFTVVGCIFLGGVVPAPHAAAQQCDEPIISDFNDPFHHLTFGVAYPPGAAVWWRAGDYFNYNLFITAGGTADVQIHYYNTSGVYSSIIATLLLGENFTIPVHTAGVAIVSNASFDAILCGLTTTPTPTFTATLTPSITPTPSLTFTPSPTPTSTEVPPTATPFPTLSPSLTPTELIEVTVTPSPTITATPIDIPAQLNTISVIAYNQLLWSVGAGVALIGLSLLAFFRVRL